MKQQCEKLHMRYIYVSIMGITAIYSNFISLISVYIAILQNCLINRSAIHLYLYI